MQKKTDVLIIGGGPAGIILAATGKKNYPDKDIMLVRKEEQVLIPNGIPYLFGTLENIEQNTVSHDKELKELGIKIEVNEVTSIDPEKQMCIMNDGKQIGYKKLILATGSKPVIPNTIKGTNNAKVFTIPKNKEYLDEILNKIQLYEDLIIIGGGSTGIEMADELSKTVKEVTIIEAQQHILNDTFDQELIDPLEKKLKAQNIKLKTEKKVEKIIDKKNTLELIMANKEKLNTDAVILATGYRPRTKLAESSGIDLNQKGFIKVDEYFRTSKPNIFAIGDCADKKNFLTNKSQNIMLASTACTEARILGRNLFKLKQFKNTPGTLPIFLTIIGETAFGAAGITEKQAQNQKLNVVTGMARGIDRHPGTFKSTNRQIVKLIADKTTGLTIGGEVIGGSSAGELLNVIGMAIQNKMSVNSLYAMQLGVHPLLTGSPGGYTVIKAAEKIMHKIS